LINNAFSYLQAGGCGGSIFAHSEIAGEREIKDCRFISNIASNTNSGNDIFDNSSVSHSFYSKASVKGCSSTSLPSQFIVKGNLMSIVYDCLLDVQNACEINTVYVNGNISIGFDYNLCGKEEISACLSITKASTIVSGVSGTVFVSSGNYNDTTIKIYEKTIYFVGPNKPGGNSESISIISVNPVSFTETTALVNIGSNANGLFTNFSYICNSSLNGINGVRLFQITSNTSSIIITNCSFSRNSSANYEINLLLIESAGNMVSITECSFSNILLSNYPLLLINTTNVSPNINISGCEFRTIKTQGEFPSVLSSPQAGCVTINVENSVFESILNTNYLNENGGIIYINGGSESSLIFTSNKVNNISVMNSVNGGVVNVEGVFDKIFFRLSNFSDIESGKKGGCIYFGLNAVGISMSCTIEESCFSLCGSFYGGGVYVETIIVYFNGVQFSGNSGLFCHIPIHFSFIYILLN
jgi:hypothetical protein